ncbi:MAG: hypothetical protein NE334_09685 [Lentisphaeraceae bacterium]|nr:hypothetical protein [Lentisphaeraceae bacterium]
MIKGLMFWGTLLTAGFGYTYHAASSGAGIPQPKVKPPSIREGSVKNTSGRMRTRYFVGGGLHGGK